MVKSFGDKLGRDVVVVGAIAIAAVDNHRRRPWYRRERRAAGRSRRPRWNVDCGRNVPSPVVAWSPGIDNNRPRIRIGIERLTKLGRC